MSKNSELQKSIDDIVLAIKTGVVIPVVGYDLLFNEFENQNEENDFLKLLIKKHAENDDQQLKDKVFVDEKKSTGYELINTYYHSLAPRDKQVFKLDLSRTIKNGRLNWQLIPESFRKLVSIKHFKFFINGTFTNTLELALNTYRGVGKNPEDIKSSYSVFNYHPIHPQDLPSARPPRRFYLDFEKPVIYNLFNTHDEIQGDYLLTDADYIELIYDLMQDKGESFKNLLGYLNKANLLFLGCNFPDWFFRFFIRVCVGDRLDAAPDLEKKMVIDSLNNLDSSRSVFISHYKIQTLRIDCNTLIDEIYKVFLKDKETSNVIAGKGNSNVFISYCRADEQLAYDIAEQLDDKYIEYFLDNSQLRSGDSLNDSIASAIDKCCIFLPVVSNNIAKASPYIWREWKYAVDRKKTIWPVFKEFVDRDMLLPPELGVNAEVRDAILNKNNICGITLSQEGSDGEIAARGNVIAEQKLKDIKETQFHCRVSGNKQ